MECYIWDMTLGLGLLSAQSALGQALTAQTLLVEAATMLRQADAADGEERVGLLRQAQDRLRRSDG
jgi:hypothetical protein